MATHEMFVPVTNVAMAVELYHAGLLSWWDGSFYDPKRYLSPIQYHCDTQLCGIMQEV